MSFWGKAFHARLPDGSYAESQEEYYAAWDEMVSFLESMFPGYKVFGYDPGFMLSHPDVRNGALSITGHAVKALMEGVEARQKTANKKPRRKGKPA